jgi:hypothetical protein
MCGFAVFACFAGRDAAKASSDRASAKPPAPVADARSRTIVVNDLSGDIDGLFATVHQAMSTSTELRAVVGTQTGRPGETAERSADFAHEMLRLMGLSERVKVHAGAPGKITTAGVPVLSPGAQAIIDEALRTDTALPLYVAVGGALTEVASALMIAPEIADRFTLVWIGGAPYPTGGAGESNFGMDPLAAQFVFNETAVPLWQVPSDVYGTCLVSNSELQAYVAPAGPVGAWLYGKLIDAPRRWKGAFNAGETWTLGDSPLVVLTALNDWYPNAVRTGFRYERTGSSLFEEIVAPRLAHDGAYEPRSGGRKIRVYKTIDTRMMFADFFAKLRLNSGPNAPIGDVATPPGRGHSLAAPPP